MNLQKKLKKDYNSIDKKNEKNKAKLRKIIIKTTNYCHNLMMNYTKKEPLDGDAVNILAKAFKTEMNSLNGNN